MKVSGFTFIRNAIKYDYPVEEAIRSILPLCDEVVVAVGKSEDETLELIRGIGPKVRIIETVWDESLKESGLVLSDETNKAFRAIGPEADWAFYIQGDEVLHEKYVPVVREAMERNLDDGRVEGLLFNYLHFYGSYDYTGASMKWYRREIRVVRNDRDIISWLDAQGFRKKNGRKLKVRPIEAWIYHYGWVREPTAMQKKKRDFGKLWHGDDWEGGKIYDSGEFDYSGIGALRKFEGSHPELMKKRIARKNWKFEYDLTANKWSLKDRIKRFIERLTGWRPGEYRNYRILK